MCLLTVVCFSVHQVCCPAHDADSLAQHGIRNCGRQKVCGGGEGGKSLRGVVSPGNQRYETALNMPRERRPNLFRHPYECDSREAIAAQGNCPPLDCCRPSHSYAQRVEVKPKPARAEYGTWTPSLHSTLNQSGNVGARRYGVKLNTAKCSLGGP